MKFQISPDDMPSPELRAEWQDMIDSLREYARKELSRWEREFLDSIDAQLATHGVLTRPTREARGAARRTFGMTSISQAFARAQHIAD